MFTYCFNNEFISIFYISLLCILYFYDDERCKMNFPVRDNKVLLYCIVLYCIVLYCIVLYCIVLYCIVLYSNQRSAFKDGRRRSLGATV